MKLIALGDSITKGVLFVREDDRRNHYSLADYNFVDLIASKMQYDIVNWGKMGATIDAGERILNRNAASLDGVKYALICYGGNDSDYDWKAIADNPDGEHSPKTPLRVFEKAYVRIINMVREKGCIPLVISLPPVNAQTYFNHFTNTFSDLQKSNVLKWLKGSVDTIWAGHELYNDAIKRVAATTDSILVDVTTSLGNGDSYLCEDGIHPNLAGHTKIASIIKNTWSLCREC